MSDDLGVSMSLSDNAKKELLKQECFAMFPYLIEITDLTDNTVYRYVNMNENLTVDGVEYTSQPFSVKPAEKSDDKIGNGSLTLYDCSIEWIPRVQNANKRFQLRFVSLIRYDENNTWKLETIEDENYTLKDFSWGDSNEISCTMVYDENMDILMPMDKMDSVICPAVF